MEKFTVGQRVRVFSQNRVLSGKITSIDNPCVYVEFDHNPHIISGLYHKKQCRRLKPKAKPIEFECEWHRDGGVTFPIAIFPPEGFSFLNFLGKRTKVRVTVLP